MTKWNRPPPPETQMFREGLALGFEISAEHAGKRGARKMLLQWAAEIRNPTKNDPAEARPSSTRKGEQVTRS